MGKEGPVSTGRKILYFAATTLVLLAVIFIGGALSDPKRDADADTPAPQPAPATSLSPEIQAAKLANEAQAALSSGETTAALALAQKSLALDPKNATATSVVTKVKTSSTSSSKTESAGSSGSNTKPKKDPYASKVKDITTLLPVKIAGWIPGPGTSMDGDALVSFEPEKGTAPYKSVTRAVLTVHDRTSSAKADEFIEKVDKRGYSKSPASVKVNDVSAYFGTDGGANAMVAFARGRYAFEVMLTVPQGVDPIAVKNTAIVVARTLPASNK